MKLMIHLTAWLAVLAIPATTAAQASAPRPARDDVKAQLVQQLQRLHELADTLRAKGARSEAARSLEVAEQIARLLERTVLGEAGLRGGNLLTEEAVRSTAAFTALAGGAAVSGMQEAPPARQRPHLKGSAADPTGSFGNIEYSRSHAPADYPHDDGYDPEQACTDCHTRKAFLHDHIDSQDLCKNCHPPARLPAADNILAQSAPSPHPRASGHNDVLGIGPSARRRPAAAGTAAAPEARERQIDLAARIDALHADVRALREEVAEIKKLLQARSRLTVRSVDPRPLDR